MSYPITLEHDLVEHPWGWDCFTCNEKTTKRAARILALLCCAAAVGGSVLVFAPLEIDAFGFGVFLLVAAGFFLVFSALLFKRASRLKAHPASQPGDRTNLWNPRLPFHAGPSYQALEELVDPLSNTAAETPTDNDGLKPSEQWMRDAFNAFDANSDGLISPAELRAVMVCAGDPISMENAEEMVWGADMDHDGHVNFEEFVRMMRLKMRDTDNFAQAPDAFRVFDPNGDGMIDAIELRHVLANLGFHFSIAQVDQMIQEGDPDGNGKINYRQFAHMIGNL
ncbi:uncharacterized protein LOC129601827 [Paramacrobiotus metropolitanus]|uniref:uncharacterized protein LOC129601827 n=1 Tax=Paramacrobiotus metropolitanus TaxID=2943436 RepID=UPI002445FD9D|nr:uncharacterized protein LOC129601827 [Paramacrobiotus metropolitanus]